MTRPNRDVSGMVGDEMILAIVAVALAGCVVGAVAWRNSRDNVTW